MDSFPKSKIYFRADGNTKIGLGHITRSLALADMLKEYFDIWVMIQQPSREVIKQIHEVTPNIIELSPSENYLEEARFIAEKYLTGEEIVVLDGYNFQTDYQRIIKSKGVKLVCIDDLHAWHFVADVVINHAGGVKESDYSCEPYTKLCLGLEYALLRKPFLEAAKQERKIEKIENVFICFGGSDPHNFTEKALNACIEAQVFREIHVVVGSAYTHFASLKDLTIQEKNVFLYQNLNAQDLCNVMQKCQVGIVSASSIAYECLAVGMYLIVGYYAENQKAIYQGLINKNHITAIDNYIFFSFNKETISKQSFLCSKSFQNYFGNTKKITETFLELIVHIRLANEQDIDLYFEWANDIEVRRNSINQEPILYNNHCKWFREHLNDESIIFYVGLIKGIPFGQIRIDRKGEFNYINYTIDKKFRGIGLGKILINKTINLHKDFKWVACVKSSNKPSKKIFERLNFTNKSDEEINGELYKIYRLETK
ncbi:UDP-2,4-diacetamido-2,4,6-trideoxy-beta-L-altropyranose hydrolase [Raineya orbicola]|uniref:PseG: pseudaminic acid biosynthesis-associated protein PseG n=1 Tax=Raineya orbicola TaxID=2016530 RepID=A0A2N3IKI5_9BACT|nr:UDP-2,4-diacetamido-2,4,6-trideoxy-beta-L-altropyranose hydrolase [Raineya orbicola]PKQ70846.1 PseG: pseudaminic acid biosynthesis-associated protein PseG [Raineya orbicola]